MFFFRHDRELHKQGILNALGAFAYIIAVVMFISSAEKLFGQKEPGILAPIGFLLLFVLSAAVMSMLVFGGPAMLYLDGKKKEAVRLVGWTVGALAGITVSTLAVLAISSI